MENILTLKKFNTINNLIPLTTIKLNEGIINHLEYYLFENGYKLSDRLKDKLKEDPSVCYSLYNDLKTHLSSLLGYSDYKVVYTDFPKGVNEMYSFEDFLNVYGYLLGLDLPEYPETEVEIDKQNRFKELKVIDYNPNITEMVSSIMSSPNPPSGTDIDVITQTPLDTCKEVLKLGVPNNEKKSLLLLNLFLGGEDLPTDNAEDVLRVCVLYFNNTTDINSKYLKFKNLSSKQKRILNTTLNNSFSVYMEETFKSRRELWLRLLYKLNPMTKKNAKKYPVLYKYANLLRNKPEVLSTYNSKVEYYINRKDEEVFKLLNYKMGVFTRRLDHLIRVFGVKAYNEWVKLEPTKLQLITIYNHLVKRNTEYNRYTTINKGGSNKVLIYQPNKETDNDVLEVILSNLRLRIKNFDLPINDARDLKVYISEALNDKPLIYNTRSNNINYNNGINGKLSNISKDIKTLRFFLGWEGKGVDLDFSCMLINKDYKITKYGWNGRQTSELITYSGDNTGRHDKNIEYFDINLTNENEGLLIFDATIYSIYINNFNEVNGQVGYMELDKDTSDTVDLTFYKDKVIESTTLNDEASRSKVLFAVDLSSRKVLTLDLSINTTSVTSNSDIAPLIDYVKPFFSDSESKPISQGEILTYLYSKRNYIVDNIEESDLIFDNQTPIEEILNLIK